MHHNKYLIIRFIDFYLSNSGTLKETSGLHLDLFEVIKSAITSTQNGGAITVVDMGEPDREVTTTSTEAEGEMAAVKVDTPSNYFDGLLRHLVVAAASLSHREQILLVLFVLYLVAKMMFLGSRNKHGSGEVMYLAQRVEELTKEVREMKAILDQNSRT